ncbi:MAG: hypothetical protein QOJ03_888 [Frankiaceae bacterium]|jgi:predicted RNase H-like nuclease|nr:hypothetical protein [Frankiaceae bacterium]
MTGVGVLGVDGWHAGWVGALVEADRVEWQLFSDAASIVAADADAIAIDMPMGLVDRGRRACDVAARNTLGPARASVFFAPPRIVVARPAEAYADALAWLRANGEELMSAQAFGIVAKVRDVDSAVTPDLQRCVVEAHPELSFRRLAGRDVMPAKKTAAGVAARIRALSRWRDDIVDVLAAAPVGVPVDDALDALACAWTAERWHRRAPDLLVLGDGARDARGLAMRIVV